MRTFELKEDCCLEDIQLLQPAAMILLTHAILYCQEHNLPCKITSISSDRINISSKSRTHQEHRAIDFSTVGWTAQSINRFVALTNMHYREIAAISASDGQPRAAIYHNYQNQGDHIHLQVRNNAPWQKFIKY